MLRVTDLFALVEPEERELFDGLELPWDALRRIPDLEAYSRVAPKIERYNG
jgi:hypothetical protein